ncbi:MAG: conjugal transfer protein TraC [Candidatus Campbellbacteria bacterium]|nr:conjugal transfer protein TraC [Candidatus Campbellbacteria bacterium]
MANEELKYGVPEKFYENKALGIVDLVAPPALKIASRSVSLGRRLARTFFVISYPSFLSENWFAPIINLDKEFDISLFIHPIDTEKALRKFRRKVAEVQSQILERETKGLIRDPKLDTAYQDLERLRTLLQQAQERLFDAGLYITVYGKTEEDLDRSSSEIESFLESRIIYIKPATFQQEQGFKSMIPVGDDLLSIHTKLNSEPLSSFFPFVSSNLSHDDGILFGINRHNSSLILFDRFSLPNYNSVTFAKSGGGKSYAMKLEILRSLMVGVDVIVIDPEREFEYLAKAVDGRYFNISLNSEHHINPFDLPAVLPDERPSDILRANIINLLGLFKIMLGGLSAEEDAILDQAITETYALKDITPKSDFSKISPPLISDLELVLAGMDGAEGLVQRLAKYTRGSWSRFINQPTNVDINRKMIVFSIRDMEDDLKPAAMYIVTRYIWNSIRRELKRRLLVVDEAWVMMKSEDTASFLYGLVKRGRKYYLGVATITQDVEDFLGSKYGGPILTNSSLQLLLRQSTASIDVVQETFNLTEAEKFLLLQANVGEGIFIAGLKRAAIKIISSYTEHQIITSDPSQILSIKRGQDELNNEGGESKII